VDAAAIRATCGRTLLARLGGVRLRKPRIVELGHGKAGRPQGTLEPAQGVFGRGTEPVVAKHQSAIVGEVERRLVVAAPGGAGGHGRGVDPVDLLFVSGKEPDRAQPQQALDDARVMTQGEHEERVGKDLGKHPSDEDVARKRVAERGAPLALGRALHELDGMTLDLAQVLVPVGLPFGRDEAGQPSRSTQLNRQGTIGEIQGPVLPCVQNGSRAAEIIADHRGPGPRRTQDEDRSHSHGRRLSRIPDRRR